MADLSASNVTSIDGNVDHDAVDAGQPVKVGGRAYSGTPTAVADQDRTDAWFGTRGQLAAMLVDAAGVAVATGAQYTEDAALGAVGTGIGTLLIARASAAAPTSVSADADAVGLWASRFGALNVITRDTSGAYVSGGGGTQYVGDAAATATPTGTISMGLANTTGPTDVSAANDAVALWATPKGALNVVLRDATGNAIATSFPADALSNSNVGAAVLGLGSVYNGTTWDRMRSAAGVTGVAAVGGLTASDAVLAAAPVTIGGRASNAAPTAMSADGDVVDARFTRTGALNVYMVDQAGAAASLGGGTQYASDVAMGTATGTVAIGRASSPVPGSVSTDGDAVALWATGSGALVVDGGVAHDAADSGNPIKIGGKASATPFANVTANDRANVWVGLPGQMMVSNIIDATSVGADAVNMGRYLLPDGNAATNPIGAGGHVFNGTTWDRARSILGVVDDQPGASTDLGITAAGIGPGYARRPAAVAATGATTATVNAKGAQQVVFNVAGTYTGFAATVQVSYDGTNYVTANALQGYIDGLGVAASGVTITATAATGNVFVNTWGAQSVRLNITAVASGTATVTPTANAIGSIPGGIAGNFLATSFPGDASTNSVLSLAVLGFESVFNGTTWDRARSAAGVTGSRAVGGLTASDAAIASAPITVGGRSSTASPTAMSADGDVVDAWFTRRGSLTVELRDDAGNQPSLLAWSNADAQVVANVTGLSTLSQLWAYNGTTADKVRTAVGVTGALAVGGPTASDGVLAVAPITIGARASTAIPTAVSADGDVVDLRALRTGALTVHMVDATGAAASIGGGTQYVGDAAATATPTGTMSMGLANTSAPTDVSAANDAVALWVSPKGALNVTLRDTAGAAILTGVQYVEDAAITSAAGQGTYIVGRGSAATPTAVSTDGDAVGAWFTKDGRQVVDGGIASDAADTGNPIKIGGRARTSAITAVANNDRVDAVFTTFGAQAMALYDHFGNGSAVVTAAGDGLSASDAGLRTNSVLLGYNGTTNDSIRTSPGVTGTLSVGGRTAADAALVIAPITMGGRASTAVPAAMSADGDVVDMWMTRNGAQVVTISDSSGNGTAATAGSVDAVGNTATALLVQTRPTLFNGTAWDRARSIEALSTAPNADIGIPAVGTGPGWDRKRTASAMAVTLNAATTVVVNGAASITFALKFNTVTVGTGTLIFEVAADDVTPTWVTAPTVMKMPDQTAVAGTFVPATGTQYMISVAGWRQVRVRVAAALTSGTIDVLTTASAADAILTLADRQRVVSYGAVFRLAEAATSLALSFTHVANTTKQYATIHHAATALKLVKIRKVTFWLYSTSAALDGVLELRRITSAPATGNPAITPAAHDPAAPAAEVTCLALPTTAGTEAAVNSPVASIGLNTGIVAGGTSNNAPVPFILFDADKYTDMQALNIRPLTLEGWAIDLRTVGTPAVKATIEVQLTEE